MVAAQHLGRDVGSHSKGAKPDVISDIDSTAYGQDVWVSVRSCVTKEQQGVQLGQPLRPIDIYRRLCAPR
jgi:hypothetical protein